MSAPENPSVFPYTRETYADERGMELRDWFAGQVLPAVMAEKVSGVTVKVAAQTCYAIADAMLAARSQASS